MFELDGSQFEKGVLEIRLARLTPKPWAWALQIGPIRGRLVALAFILGASAVTIYGQPARFLVGYGMDPLAAARYAHILSWILLIIGAAVYALAFVLRQERLDLVFDRREGSISYEHSPLFAKARVRSGLIPFKEIKALRFSGPDREPRTPYGFIEIDSSAPAPLNAIRFRVLSEEQAKFYPLNLARILQKEPEGDWSDPGDELASPRA